MWITPNYPVLAKRLYALRTKKRLSQKRLGELAGISRITIRAWERERFGGEYTYDTFVALAEQLEVSVAYLTGLDTPKGPEADWIWPWDEVEVKSEEQK